MKKLLFNLGMISSVFLFYSCAEDETNLSLDSSESIQQFDPSIFCGSDDAMKSHFAGNQDALDQYQAFEKFTANHISNLSPANARVEDTFIPVVFHVYGTDFAGTTVDEQTIITALEKVNDDFNGLNPDFDTVDPFFQDRRGISNIYFKLAQKDPEGNPTSGVVFHLEKNGYGNRSSDADVAADAWDNYKYCNVYIQLDLYDNNQLNNSGVAWYPDASMSDANTARIVFNGRYLYGNTDDEFASTLSHEFGHWLNLIHTFEGGCSRRNVNKCSTTGDRVCDTPQNKYTNRMGCDYTRTNCVKEKINLENYMDYVGAGGCYKMFTQGQVDRMDAALQHPARFNLWQQSNHSNTGI